MKGWSVKGMKKIDELLPNEGVRGEAGPNQKYIVRTARAGVFFGEIVHRSVAEVEMRNVRKLWFWSGACGVEQLAMSGVRDPNGCKFTVVVPGMLISEPIQVIPATPEAVANIEAVAVWKS